MIAIGSDELALRVNEAGCTIASLVDLRSGEELLWSAEPKATMPLGPRGAASREYFDRHVFAGGWFPMFPMAGGTGSRIDLRLHGEAPRVEWDLSQDGPSEVIGRVVLSEPRASLERTIRVAGPTVTVTTVVRNSGGVAFLATEGEHPCFAVHRLDIDAVLLPGTRVAVNSGSPEHTVLPAYGVACIPSPTLGAEIVLTWDTRELPGVVVWQDRRGILAVEPKSFVGRSADDVGADWRRIAPDASMQWQMKLTIRRNRHLDLASTDR